MSEFPIKNRFWQVVQAPVGFPVEGKDVVLQEEPIPTLEANQFLVKINVLSLDPFHRGTMNPVAYGKSLPYPRKMIGGGVGEVIKSSSPGFSVGDVVQGDFGWQEYVVSDGIGVRKIEEEYFPLSYHIGVLGMPGATAYFGLLDLTNPKEGETVVVSAASGAVGQVVGQIAKIKGCKVIGIAGDDDKCAFCKEIGYDSTINYKGKSLEQLTEELSKAAPNGIDIYFDNTGGVITDAVFSLLNTFGRVSVCGQIAYYNLTDIPKTAAPLTLVCLRKQLKVEGFTVSRWLQQWPKAFAEIGGWIKEGKVNAKETKAFGIEGTFKAFLTLFQESQVGGTNFGKLVVKISENSKGLKVTT